jgi:hypothetical protein
MTAEQWATVQAAARLWEAKFSDPITVIINVGCKSFDHATTLGSTSVMVATHTYENVRAALLANAVGADERRALDQLPSGSSVSVVDLNGTRDDDHVTMTTANAKALNLGIGADGHYDRSLPNDADASIQFNNAIPWDYDRTDGIPADRIDFLSVALHEIGHALGFFSGTDSQDSNPSDIVHPNTLDLWRFAETGSTHSLASDTRFMKSGAAEYYDSVYPNRSFARGKLLYDSLCGCTGHLCQASHWRDRLLNQLMDPTEDWGGSKDIHEDDLHALSYIGYERADPWVLRDATSPLGFGRWRWLCLACPPVLPQDWPEEWPPMSPPPPVPFQANMAMVIGLQLTLPGEPAPRLRSAFGYARFENARTNPFPTFKGLPVVEGQMHTFPDPVRAELLPPALTDLYFVSDRSNGVPFSARALFSTSGAQFNPSLGAFGGYRIPLAIDAEGDGVTGDLDALMTIELLADQRGVPDPQAQNTFLIATGSPDNVIRVVDSLALGIWGVGGPKTEQETNNSVATATDLGSPAFVSVLGAISYPGLVAWGDIDFYRFAAPANAKAWITVDTGGPMAAAANSRDCFLSLWPALGVHRLEEDDNDGSGNGCDSTLETGDASAIAGCNLGGGGDYYIEIRAVHSFSIIDPYRLFLSVTTGPIPAEVESNNTIATANPILDSGAVSAVRSGSIATSSDVDCFALRTAGRSLLHISADGDPSRTGTGTDLIVELLRSNPLGKLEVLFQANSSAQGDTSNPPAEGFAFLVPTAGVYCVRVKGASGDTGPYHLMVATCPASMPPLSIQRADTGLRVVWPADAFACTLQSSLDLLHWSNAKLAEKYENDCAVVEVPSPAARQFFRLSSP